LFFFSLNINVKKNKLFLVHLVQIKKGLITNYKFK
jgi:hypothetical protein